MNFKLPKILSSIQDTTIKKSLIVVFLRSFGAALQIIVLLVITNNASEELVGQYNYFNSTIIVLSAIILLGMNNSFLQFSGKLEANGNFEKIVSLYKKNLLIIFLVFITITLLYGFVVNLQILDYFKDPEIILIINKVFLVILPFSITLLNLEVLRALDYLYFSEILRNIARHGVFLLFICVLLIISKINYLLDVFIISFLVLAVLSSIVIVLKMKTLTSSKEGNISYKEIVFVSFPMSFSLISLLIMQSFDIYVLENYYTFREVAYYGIAIKISAVVGIILTSINATIAPKISKLFFGNNFNDLDKLIKKATKLNAILTIPLILFLIVFSSLILSFFGQGYLNAQKALYIILAGQVVNALCGPVALYLNMTGRQVFFQKVLLLVLMLNIILNLVLIPKYEMVGAAISTAFSFVLWNIFGLIFILKKDKINLSIFRFQLRKVL